MTPRFAAITVAALLWSSTASAAPLLVQSFDDVAALQAAGWEIINNSSPAGTTDWFQGNSAVFGAQAGAANAYAAANLNAVDGIGDISLWLITPTLTLNDGDTISFYTRAEEGSEFPDRLELRLSANGASTDVGTTEASVGDFSTLLFALNPALSVGGYPTAWTQFSVPINGLGPVSGRLAFRYFVTNSEVNANYIGLDSLVVERAVDVPEPSAVLLGIAGAVVAFGRRQLGQVRISRRGRR